MNKKNVLLINPPLHFDNDLPHSLDVSVPPLGLLYLASYINHYSNSLNASVIDIGAEKISLSETLKRIKKQKPFVIGLTSMTPQLQGTVELAKCLKKSFPKVKIFLGGPHISADPGFINRFRVFDYAITGEAEKTFLDSLKKLVSGKKIPRIQSSEVIDNLDSIPFPDKELIDRNKYFKRESMMFSRGCPYNCYYCS
ncbi:cobalamin-dependent protein, partial [Patescibacteria group bacterium]|nr:cobalamin-dependent protein [Patescibacteria group bacterium]